METNYYIGISDKLFEILKWITPVILFFLTYFINELIHFRKKRKRLKDLKNLLITHLDTLQKEINDQIEANLNCISSTRDFNNPDVRLSRHYANNLERIKQIPFDEAYQILIKDPSRKYKKKEYYFDRYTRL
jgi:hypothetical protein